MSAVADAVFAAVFVVASAVARLPIDRRRDDRTGMHIQPNTRTFTKHRGLLTHVGKAEHGNPALGNLRGCVSEVPASNYSAPRVVTTYGLSAEVATGFALVLMAELRWKHETHPCCSH
ncbi:hypothetical protein RW1_066_00300 [Rhodococcus wratislaviensis NBRC 100605]|uniref:Uncharacterized protein n=1 Tax=Rhodococcus wratislaviensis NBRC 100605 TaxID=1219028 RepID=X0PZP9_RHOWR|nr:hypothetical protein RW1_066_00300 [Rhodococcus wratislaviensis NBRC 100605]